MNSPVTTGSVRRTPAPAGAAAAPPGPARGRRITRLSRIDPWRAGLAVLACVPTAVLAFLVVRMVIEAWPAIRFNGWSFFTTKTFAIGNFYGGTLQHHNGYVAAPGARFGVLVMLVGTVLSSLIALVIAVPVAVGGAIVLAEKLPAAVQAPLGVLLELLAGVPSVVFGLWGVMTLGPWVSRNIYQPIANLGLPWLSSGVVSNGQGLFTSALVLAVMIIPIIASITRELVRSVPALSREGAVALGLTGSEAVRVVTLPFIRKGVIAAAVLGLARALGETIAVLIISGNALSGYPDSIFAPFASMAGTIAATLDSALTDSTGMATHALAEVGLVLLLITLLTNLGGRMLADRMGGTGLPVGRGV